ncbi:hypothetical protein [Alkalicoccobacillus porphyridii]|uniref:Uncharacterized protein n=1 Tax=Alkalicoccobacillus porphyridii TaxID=2597270 RepID=A0A553ZWB3_9BACI|nr:hypothetical protein [Alkalicoccobacillus porphyridii]TSB45747.1 hypothetical protein FN960_14775 [Alkalicoccobacillus porphyridii]
MKKILMLSLMIFLTACGASDDTGDDNSNETPASSVAPSDTTTDNEEPSANDSNNEPANIQVVVSIGDPPADPDQPFPGFNAEDQEEKNDFIYRLVSEKEEYQVGESVKITAELTYIGDEKEVTIGHAESPFYFTFYEHLRGYGFSHAMAEPYITQSIKHDKSYQERYRGQVVYGSDDEADTEFLEQIAKNTQFPVGEYTVTGRTDFNIDGEPGYEPIKLEAEISFTVVE